MFMMPRFIALAAILPAVLALGCGGENATVDKINDAAPAEISGGGVGSGAIDGKINVYVIDAVTEMPISGAAVRIGEADDASPLMGTTDSTGLFTVKDASLQGATTITVTAADHAPSTWLGVNGANVTIPIGPQKAPTIDTANAEGTIAGWDALPATANHIWAAFIGTSGTGKLGDPANDIQQPPSGMGIPANACLKFPPPAPATPCNWKLVTRTGKQIRFAVIVDVDTKGTLMDQSDDTRTFYGYAFKLGLDLKAGATSTGESLDMFPTDALMDLSIMVPAAPAGMDESAAIPLLNMGDQGQVPFYFGDQVSVPKIPGLTNVFASGSYDLVSHADLVNSPYPSTSTYSRMIDLAKPFTVPAYQATPTDLAATGGVYSFKPVSDATIHSVHFDEPTMGSRSWNVSIYDGRTSFSLPSLTPDPLPVGTLDMVVEAVTVPGVDVQNFDVHTAQDKLTAISINGIEITH